MKIVDFSYTTDIINVILFGSTAREDADEFSDVDIFLLVEDVSQERTEELIQFVKEKLEYDNIGFSLYRKSIFEKLMSEGSMFLWHLKTEGKYIYSRDNLDLFKDLKPFENFTKNLNIYTKLYSQTINSIKVNGSNAFDFSQLFFICRNICLLTCYRLGFPTFGRIEVYSKLVDYLNFTPIDWENYIYLSKWRLNYTRGVGLKINQPNPKKLLELFQQIEALVKICTEIIIQGENNERIRYAKKNT